MAAGQTYDLSPCMRYFRGLQLGGALDMRTIGDAGPYTGIHLFFHNSLKYGVGNVVAATNHSSTILTIPDPTDGNFETRGFVLNNSFKVTDNM